jgi:phage terminase large subunit-like protein
LRPWQQDIVCGLFDAPRPRQGLVSIPRGNGKSTLAAALGLYGLFADGVEGAQVLCVASDERQARIVFNAARRMVELEPRLDDRCQIFQNKIYVPHTDSSLFTLPAEQAALQGYDPSLAVVDELGVVTHAVWESVSLAAGKRDTSLVLAISTPAADTDSVMGVLVEHGRTGDDSSFYFTEYAAPAGCAIDDEDAWTLANPALDDFLHRDALRSVLRTSRESSFRRFRLGQWVAQVDGAWLPDGAWAGCAVDGFAIPDGADVVLGLDGSFSQDCTALVAVTVEAVPHVDVVALWESTGTDYRVPVVDVEAEIRQACRRFAVRQIVADPFRWTRTLQALEAEGLPVAVADDPGHDSHVRGRGERGADPFRRPAAGPAHRSLRAEGGRPRATAGQGAQAQFAAYRPGGGRADGARPGRHPGGHSGAGADRPAGRVPVRTQREENR